ncbi:MAG: hypothetical protein JSU66_10035 [Deltaproteobacteria bacterium]|nr:MAG: hypothetical protein JSU66_10035 [Deltaproteobacteria bacterium]
MRGFSAAGAATTLRARRWDVIVLGGALPGLVAAARLGRRGLRVLVVEEAAATRAPDCLREPFLLPGGRSVLDACLRELALPLIDRRRIHSEAVAYQVVLPEARINVGAGAATAEELVAWGLADPDDALDLVRSIERAAQAELSALLESPMVRSGGLRSLVRTSPRAGLARGLPEAAARPDGSLRPVLDAQVRGLSDLGATRPPPEARARLLGCGLEGGARFERPEDSLRGLLRRRVESVHGEFRSVDGAFEFVAVGNQPGIAVEDSGGVWVGRAIVVNAPCAALAAFLRAHGRGTPDFLDAPESTHRRVAVRFRAPREILPEGMSRRVIHVADPERSEAGGNVTRLAVFPAQGGDSRVDLVGAAVVGEAEADRAAVGAELEAIATRLMPFSESKLVAQTDPVPRWDDHEALVDPWPGAGWPGDVEIRAVSRPPVYRLPREDLAALGIEGDLLLGWRAGDAIAAELA